VKPLKYIVSLLIVATMASFSYTIDDVVTAVRLGDAAKLSRFFDEKIEISLQDRSHTYSKSQAEMVLRDFFRQRNVKSFQVVLRGNTQDSEYCVGSLQTGQGLYRTTIFLKIRGDRKCIREIRFE
jgi:hypothetical protein